MTLNRIAAIIEKLDYIVIDKKRADSLKWIRRIRTLAVIILLYYLLQHFGILNLLVPSMLADSQMSYGMLFIVGLLTSVHCIQYVESNLDFGTYPEITVYTGIPVKWTINVPEEVINGCNYKMIVKTYGITHEFTPGKNVIEFTPGEPGTVQYTCWMGMIYGEINVVDKQGE